MKKEMLCVGARSTLGEHTCQLMLRPKNDIPGGLWSWWVYVDGNVNARGPGSKRKDPVHWYTTLLAGEHRLVVRAPVDAQPNRAESNTLYFSVENQSEITVDVSFINDALHLEIASEK